MVKKLFRMAGTFRRFALLSSSFIILEALVDVSIPLIMADMIDRGVEAGDADYILRRGMLLIAAALLSLTFGVLSAHFAAYASAGFAKNLRRNTFYGIQRFSFTNLDHFPASGLITRLTTDVSNVQQAFMMSIRMGTRSPSMLLFAMVMAFRINQRLALVYLVILPFMALGLGLIMKLALPVFEDVYRTYDEMNRVVMENLRGIRVVKSFVREDHEIEKFRGVSDQLFRFYRKAERYMAGSSPLMQMSLYSTMLLISWFGARLILAGHMTTGQLMSMVTYAMQILMSLMMLSMVLVMLTISRAAASRILEVLEEEPTITPVQDAQTRVEDGSIRFEDVSFCYGGDLSSPALSHIDLDIQAGMTVGIIGGTGSGKSSLVQLIPRLYDATAGRVLVGGQDVRLMDLKALRDAVAMVLQKNLLFEGSIRDNLRWGKEDADDEELIRVCRIAQAHGFISRLEKGYDTLLEQGGSNLSGGQRQRLCIARALLKDPQILILDDSTSAVDTQTEARIQAALKEDMPKATKIVIAQRISSVRDADVILVLDEGRIAGLGSHDTLIQDHPIYREVFQSQMKGGDFDLTSA